MIKIRTPSTPLRDAPPPRVITPAEWFRCGLDDARVGNNAWPPADQAAREQYLAGYAAGVKSC